MELKQLKSFVLIAETGSFSEAATRCFLTQSAVSQHIKTLEEELGCILMIRDPHRVCLTESGEALLPRAKQMLLASEEAKEYVTGLNGKLKGELRIGVGNFIEPIIRIAALKMMELYPDVLLNVEFAKSCRLNQALRDHKLDIAFTMNTAYKEEGIESMPCIPFHIYAVMGDTHVLAKKKKVTFDDICKHNVIMPDVGDRVFSTFQKYLDEDLSRLHVKAIVSSAGAALSVLRSEKLITFLPKLYIEERNGLVAKPIEKLDKELMSNAHWMRDVPMKRTAKAFLDIINEYSIPYFKSVDI